MNNTLFYLTRELSFDLSITYSVKDRVIICMYENIRKIFKGGRRIRGAKNRWEKRFCLPGISECVVPILTNVHQMGINEGVNFIKCATILGLSQLRPPFCSGEGALKLNQSLVLNWNG